MGPVQTWMLTRRGPGGVPVGSSRSSWCPGEELEGGTGEA